MDELILKLVKTGLHVAIVGRNYLSVIGFNLTELVNPLIELDLRYKLMNGSDQFIYKIK